MVQSKGTAPQGSMSRLTRPSSISQEMDTATRVVDLARAIIDVLNNENGLRGSTHELLDWLSRERIDKQEYQYCITAIKALAYPNEKGLNIRQSVQSSEDKARSIAGLKLKLSTSIGRWMLRDPEFIYVVTTVATCMQYHKMDFAVDVLCNMAMDKGGHEKGVKYEYSIYRTRLMPVMAKFVESVALNVVNAGHDFRSILPEGFERCCNHPLKAKVFSAVVMAVSHAKGDALITSNCFPADLTTWLITHVHGHIEISVDGKIIYEQRLGPEENRVVFMITEECSCGSRGGRDLRNPAHRLKVATRLGESLVNLIDEGQCYEPRPQGTSRQKLYETDMLQSFARGPLSRDEVIHIKLAAKAMLKWLLEMPVEAAKGRVGFENRNNKRARTSKASGLGLESKPLETLLARYPAMLHKNWGGVREQDKAVYVEPEFGRSTRTFLEKDSDSDDEWFDTPHKKRSVAEILECFPVAMSLFDMLQERCGCRGCKRKDPIGADKPGCLREDGLDELLLLLSHGIADAFGAMDVSGLCDRQSIRIALCTIFEDIIEDGYFAWDNWFVLTAMVYLGGSWSQKEVLRKEGSTALGPIQQGSLVIAPAWLDLNSTLDKVAFFGANFCEGQLSGVHGDFAVVEIERVMRLGEKAETRNSEAASIAYKDSEHFDTSEASVEVAIIGAQGRPYRLLTMARSSGHRRIVDPADAIMSIHRSRYPQCEHVKSTDPFNGAELDELYLTSFDDTLRSWIPSDPDDQEIPDNLGESAEITYALDTDAKFNVAISLSPDGAVLTNECCVACAMKDQGFRTGLWNIIVRSTHKLTMVQRPRNT